MNVCLLHPSSARTRHQVKQVGGRFKTPQEKAFTCHPSNRALGHLGTWRCRYYKLIRIQEKTGQVQKRDAWKQQPETYSDCPQAAHFPGWSTHRGALPHACPFPFWATFPGQLTSLIITPMQLLVDEV